MHYGGYSSCKVDSTRLDLTWHYNQSQGLQSDLAKQIWDELTIHLQWLGLFNMKGWVV